MENATNALLIAAAVLIAIVILSLGISLYTVFTRQSDEFSKTISDTEILKFNSKFDIYVGRTDITAQEVATVINMSKEKLKGVNIAVNGKNMTNDNTFSPEKFVSENKDNLFSCIYKSEELKKNPNYNAEGKINRLEFQKNS